MIIRLGSSGAAVVVCLYVKATLVAHPVHERDLDLLRPAVVTVTAPGVTDVTYFNGRS
jgi:hypothetical protein